jgi:hypothetical protein
MGAPAYTAFCENGHIVRSMPDDCISDDEITECDLCHSKKFVILTEWPDKHYFPRGDIIVPRQPLRKEWIEVDNDHIKGRVNVDIYDTSRVPEKRWRDSVF